MSVWMPHISEPRLRLLLSKLVLITLKRSSFLNIFIPSLKNFVRSSGNRGVHGAIGLQLQPFQRREHQARGGRVLFR